MTKTGIAGVLNLFQVTSSQNNCKDSCIKNKPLKNIFTEPRLEKSMRKKFTLRVHSHRKPYFFVLLKTSLGFDDNKLFKVHRQKKSSLSFSSNTDSSHETV